MRPTEEVVEERDGRIRSSRRCGRRRRSLRSETVESGRVDDAARRRRSLRSETVESGRVDDAADGGGR
jgi:hypothetical protein